MPRPSPAPAPAAIPTSPGAVHHRRDRPCRQHIALPCPPPATVATDDKASNLAVSSLGTANQVTVYACYDWRPPLAGFLLIPETVPLRATFTEASSTRGEPP